MKNAWMLLFLTGCAIWPADTNYGGLTTTTRCYDAKVASQAGATQARVDECANAAWLVQTHYAALQGGGLSCLHGGNAFEECVRKK